MTRKALTAAERKRRRRRTRPIYFVIHEVEILKTGEERLALIAATRWDGIAMQERKYRAGDELRAELKKPRNAKFLRLAHALGKMLVEHVEDFRGLDAHSALKRIQRECGCMCDELEIDASPIVAAVLAAAESLLGAGAAKMLRAVLPEIKTVRVREPRSLAFDDMDEGEFAELWESCVAHIKLKYWPDLDESIVEEMASLIEGDRE